MRTNRNLRDEMALQEVGEVKLCLAVQPTRSLPFRALCSAAFPITVTAGGKSAIARSVSISFFFRATAKDGYTETLCSKKKVLLVPLWPKTGIFQHQVKQQVRRAR